MPGAAETLARRVQVPQELARPKILGVGTTVIDLNVSFPNGPSEEILPQRVRRLPFDKKVAAKGRADFDDYQRKLTANGAEYYETGGGNIFNVLSAVRRLTRGELAAYTWAGTDPHGEMVREKIKAAGLIPIVNEFKGDTPMGLVIPRVRHGELDKTTIGYKPEGFPSDFSDVSIYKPELVVINSLTGEEWPNSLENGTTRLRRTGTRFAVIPGSSQFEAVEEQTDAASSVYSSIEGAYLLPVNKPELIMLLDGKGVTPSEKPGELLKQGVHELGVDTLTVTFGKEGAGAADKDGNLVGVSATRVDNVRGTNRAGDWFLAGVLANLTEPGGNIEDALRLGSANASFALENAGTDFSIPGRDAVVHRLRTRPTTVLDLAS